MKLGIDVGTHYVRAAFLDAAGEPQLITLPSGATSLPAMARQTMHSLELGPGVARSLAGNMETTVLGCTRLMGWAGEIPQQLLDRLPYRVRTVGGEAVCNLLYAEVRASDIYGAVVNTMVQLAAQTVQQPIEAVVLTTPASAEDRFRTQARAAVMGQGLHVARLLNQPAAALLAAGLPESVRYVAVVNCGGGTTEVSLAEQAGGQIGVLATAGDMLLGGDEFAWTVTRRLNERFQQEDGVDVFAADDSQLAALGLKVAVAEALQQLQPDVPELLFALDHGGGFGHDLLTVLRQDEVAQWLEPHCSRLTELCQQALDATPAIQQISQIEAVLLLGDWVTLPAIQQTIARFFQRPVAALHVEDAALLPVYGAALATAEGAAVVRDVTPYALGINCYFGDEELFSPIIKANTAIPTPSIGEANSFTEGYQTRYKDQTSVTLKVLQYRGANNADPYGSEKVTPEECELLGTWTFDGLQPKPGHTVPFTVTFAINQDGILHLQAEETATGHQLRAAVERGVA